MVLKKQLKKNRKKGFTLVEVIVVLVILAILAAIAIPALTGYIDKANEKAVVSQTRSAVVAAQTIVSDAYGAGLAVDSTWAVANVTEGAIQALSGDASITSVGAITLNSSNAVATLEVGIKGGDKVGVFNVAGTPQYSVR
jgi:type IV pilus assembly protein PilA